MIQVVCEKCKDPIPEDIGASNLELERVRVVVSLGWNEPLRVRDYHRGCARTLTVPEVYQRKGLLPL